MRILFIVAAILASQTSQAQTRSVSHSAWMITRDAVTVREIIPATEARRLSPAGQPPLSNDALAAYMLERLTVKSQGSACLAIDQGYDLGRVNTLAVGPGLYGFEIIFHCEEATPPVLSNTVLDLAPGHIDYAYIEMDGVRLNQVFTARHPSIDMSAHPDPAGFFSYVQLGARHVTGSWPRLCFLLGLLLLIKSRRDGWVAAAALSCGYAASLLIPMAGWVPSVQALESAIGLLVALCAVQWVASRISVSHWRSVGLAAVLGMISVAIWHAIGEMPWTLLGAAVFSGSLWILSNQQPRVALVGLPLLFGLLDGVVLAGDFARLQLWAAFRSGPQMSFNLGALSAELGIMAVLFGGTASWRRARWRNAYSVIAEEVAATALAGLGAFWLVVQLKG